MCPAASPQQICPIIPHRGGVGSPSPWQPCATGSWFWKKDRGQEDLWCSFLHFSLSGVGCEAHLVPRAGSKALPIAVAWELHLAPEMGQWASRGGKGQQLGKRVCVFLGLRLGAKQLAETCNFHPLAATFAQQRMHGRLGYLDLFFQAVLRQQFSTQTGTSGSWASLRIALFALVLFQMRNHVCLAVCLCAKMSTSCLQPRTDSSQNEAVMCLGARAGSRE